MNPKVSIIVPVYNVEKYLDRCMESLLNQTLKDIEIILVDDGSPDKCPQMCDEYAKKDSRIRVIHKQNAGLGLARNSGLEIATGEYIAFVDSDDFVDVNIYQLLYHKATSSDFDIVFCGYYLFDNNEVTSHKCLSEEKSCNGTKQSQEFLLNLIGADYFERYKYKISCSVWKAIYKRSILINNNIKFCSERDFISEDIIFHTDLLPYINSISILPKCLYYYCLNGESLTKKYSANRFEKDIKLCIEVESKISYFIDKEIAATIANSLVFEKLQGTLSFEVNSCPNHVIKQIKKICDNTRLRKAIDDSRLQNFPIKKKIFIFCVKYKLYLLIYLYYKYLTHGNR